MNSRVQQLIIGLFALLATAGIAAAQPSFSVDFQGPPKGAPDSFPPLLLITEGDILITAPAGIPAPGPLPFPGTIIHGGAPPVPNLGLPAYAGPIGPAGFPDLVEVDALSYGTDWLLRPGAPFPEVWTFSVDEFAVGFGPLAAFPPTVATQGAAALLEAAADVYSSFPPGTMPPGPVPPFAVPLPGNGLLFDGDGLPPPGGSLVGPLNGLGLVEPLPPAPGIPPGGEPGSNLDALDVDTGGPGGIPFPVFFSLDAGFVDPIEGPPVNSGSAAANGFLPGAILVKFAPAGPPPPPIVYAPPAALGLDLFGPGSDDLDALALFENGCPFYQPAPLYGWGPCGGVCPCPLGDMLFFSVRRGSAIIGVLDSLQGLPISPGDILVPPPPGAPPGTPPGIFIAAENLGLATIRSGFGFNDDLDALDVSPDCNTNSVPDFHDIAFGLTPDLNGNGIPDPCECPCGDGFCDPTCETPCSCAADCGPPPFSEVPGSTCTDGIDNDCDGSTDCLDPDCATDPACTCPNGICDPGENPCNCPADCGLPAPNEMGLCADIVDNDCDLATDCADADCAMDPVCVCGNGSCDPGENQCNCPADCGLPTPEGFGPTCMDGIDNDCDTFIDCADPGCVGNPACLCGNGTCAPPETPCNCMADCGPPVVSEAGLCADGIDNDCDGPVDCADADCFGNPSCLCPNGVCDAPAENPCNCPFDCGPVAFSEMGRCADGIDNDCDGPIDCADADCISDPACGCPNGTCDAPMENSCNCPFDCGPPPAAETGLCTDLIDNDCDGPIDCADGDCLSDPACLCGNGTCTPPENPCTCAADCGPMLAAETGRCTDGIDNDCDGPIDCLDSDCAADPACLCGDGSCTQPENPCNCMADCGPVGVSEAGACADGIDNDCDGLIDCADADCAGDPACVCGDTICSPGENSCNCPADCPGLACNGDVNGDGDIDQIDLLIVGQCVDCSGPQLPACDVNCDGTIDLLDFGDELCLLYSPPAQCCPEIHGACTDTNLVQSCVLVPEAFCITIGGTYLGDDTLCPPGSNDCNGNGIGDGCEQACVTDLDCDDMSVCTCDRCLCGVCFHQPVEYGDVNCDCGPSPNLADILCVLQGFGNYASCPASDIYPPCSGNGHINLADILAVLQAFGGTNPCFIECDVSCPVGACCDGVNCSLETPISCIEVGGVFKGETVLCPPIQPNPCP